MFSAGESDASAAGSVSQLTRGILLGKSDGTRRHRTAVQCTTSTVPRYTALTMSISAPLTTLAFYK